MTVTEPGLYSSSARPEAEYHADTGLDPKLGRSLSASGAKTLLSSAEQYAYERTHGIAPKDSIDVGTVAHALILRNPDRRIVVADTYEWKPWQKWNPWKDKQRAAGRVVIHRGQLLTASRVAQAVRRHRLASSILAKGEPEVSMYWTDTDTGITCRARMDWWRIDLHLIADVKTTHYKGSLPGQFARTAANFDYPLSAAYYCDGIEALTGQRPDFLHIVVETEPPYAVRVVRLSAEDMAEGAARAREARRLFAEHESSGDWSDPARDDITPIVLPAYYRKGA